MLDAPPDGGPLPRRTVSERAAQRDRMHRVGRDRYSSLLHTLYAGRELPLQQQGGRARLRWHPIAGTLIRLAVVAVLLYLAITTGLAMWRDIRVDTWAGPDAAVTSGQRLADCPLVGRVHDDVFPNWIRFEGKVYVLTDSIRPMGFEVDPDFPATGYSLGSMALFRIASTPDGQAGQTMAVRLATSAVGQVYRIAPDCA